MSHLRRWNVVLGLAVMLAVVCSLPASAQEGSTTIYIPLISSNEAAPLSEAEEEPTWVLIDPEATINSNGIPSSIPYEGFGYVEEGELSPAAVQTAQVEIEMLRSHLTETGSQPEEIEQVVELARNGPIPGTRSAVFGVNFSANATAEDRLEGIEAMHAQMEAAGVSDVLLDQLRQGVLEEYGEEAASDEENVRAASSENHQALLCPYGATGIGQFDVSAGTYHSTFSGVGNPGGVMSWKGGTCPPDGCYRSHLFESTNAQKIDRFSVYNTGSRADIINAICGT